MTTRPIRLPAASLATLLLLATTLPGAQGGGVDLLGGRTPQAIAAEVAARFDPARSGAAAAVDPGESCLSPLLARLRAAAPQLGADERAALARLDPSVALVLGLGLGLAEGGGLPEHPELDLLEEGKTCLVHYTLTGEHAVVAADVAVYVRKVLDVLAKKLGKTLRAPFAENEGGPETRLHVYLAKLPDDPVLGPVNGFVVGVTDQVGTSGKPQSVYLSLSSTLAQPTDNAKTWRRKVKSTVVHEYMHCVQYAYNHQLSRWFLEGQAVWAESRIGKVKDGLAAFFETPESIFRAPEKALWEETIRMYSTSPLVHYADLVFGKQAPRLLLEGALVQDDALLVLSALAASEGLSFDEFYKAFLARLYFKTIPGLGKQDVPEFTLAGAPVDDYGWEEAGAIAVTGWRIHELEPPDHPTSLLFARVGKTGAMTGTPSAVLLHAQGKRLALGSGTWDAVDTFKKKSGAVLIATDTAYAGPTATQTPYLAEAFAPHIDVTDVDAASPIAPGGTSTITFTYDLLGTPAGLATMPVVLHVQRKGPCCPLDAPTFPDWDVGTGRTATYDFVAPADATATGAYAFKFFARVPNDVYGGEHIRSIAKTKVKVQAP